MHTDPTYSGWRAALPYLSLKKTNSSTENWTTRSFLTSNTLTTSDQNSTVDRCIVYGSARSSYLHCERRIACRTLPYAYDQVPSEPPPHQAYTWMQINELPDVPLNLRREKPHYNITQNWNPFMITQPKIYCQAHSFVRGKILCPTTTLTQNKRVLNLKVNGIHLDFLDETPLSLFVFGSSNHLNSFMLNKILTSNLKQAIPQNLFKSNWTRNELL